MVTDDGAAEPASLPRADGWQKHFSAGNLATAGSLSSPASEGGSNKAARGRPSALGDAADGQGPDPAETPTTQLKGLVDRHIREQTGTAVVHRANLSERGGSKEGSLPSLNGSSRPGSRPGSGGAVAGVRSLRRAVTHTGAAIAFVDNAMTRSSVSGKGDVSGEWLPKEPSSSSVGPRQRSRAGSMDSHISDDGSIAGAMRELTEEEAAKKRSNAVDWFAQARNINCKAQGMTLEEKMNVYRLRRAASKTISQDGTRSTSSKEAASTAGSKEASGAGSPKVARSSASTKEAVRPSASTGAKDDVRPSTSIGSKDSHSTAAGTPSISAGTSSAALSFTSSTGRPPSRPGAAEPAPATKGNESVQTPKTPKPNLLEKFGYGVKPKQEPKREPMDMSAYTKKKTVMCEVGVGKNGNDLLERLRRRERSNTVG